MLWKSLCRYPQHRPTGDGGVSVYALLRQCLEQLIREESYALLTVLNAIDWIGEEARPLIQALPENEIWGNYENRMVRFLKERFASVPVDAVPTAGLACSPETFRDWLQMHSIPVGKDAPGI